MFLLIFLLMVAPIVLVVKLFAYCAGALFYLLFAIVVVGLAIAAVVYVGIPLLIGVLVVAGISFAVKRIGG